MRMHTYVRTYIHIHTYTHTCSRKCRDKLMYFSSARRVPPTPVFATLSEPARSTRWSLAFLMVSEPGSLELKWMVKIQCERVDAMFIGVWERRGYYVAMFGREGVMMWPCLGEKGL